MMVREDFEMVSEAERVSLAAYTAGQVTSADGTVIGYQKIGSGPGLVILHGGLRMAHHYMRIGEFLANDFTVYIPDRRGRGASGPQGADYCYTKEIEDLSAIQQKTGARYVFGHSAGGAIALEAAQKLDIAKMVLYEPAVGIPMGWLPSFERAMAKGDWAKSIAIFFRAMQLNWMSSLPVWALAVFSRMMANMDEGQEMVALLPTLLGEVKAYERRLNTGQMYEGYRDISAETLLLGGEKSPGYLLNSLQVLARTIPSAQAHILPGLNHTAPDDEAPEVVAALVKNFLLK